MQSLALWRSQAPKYFVFRNGKVLSKTRGIERRWEEELGGGEVNKDLEIQLRV